MIFTAQYRYKGEDRLDVTVKGKYSLGSFFAPTWKMVDGFLKGNLSQEEYTAQYYTLLLNRFKIIGFKQAVNKVVAKASSGDVTFVCFCKNGEFCHRYLLVKWFQELYPKLVYGGERSR